MNEVYPIFAIEGLPRPLKKRRTLKEIKKIQRRAEKMSVLQFFRPLEKATEKLNRDMEQGHIPLKLSVYKKNNQIIMDVIVHDKSTKKDITGKDFCDLIHNVSQAKGLIIDKKA